MANNRRSPSAANDALSANPMAIVQGIGEIGRSFLQEVGSMFWFIAHTFDETIDRIRNGRVPFRATDFFLHTERAGVESVPLVGLVSFFLGLTMALLTGYQLQRFGTERLVPGLGSIAFTRELGPLITGIMLAARIGAAFTAELGTMTVSEEVEAIEAIGIGPLRFLVAPRMLALFFIMPCLSTISNIAAIFATSLVTRVYFNIPFVYFIDLVRDSLLIRDLITGVLKSFMFGLLIAAIACFRGLTVKGGAAGVGSASILSTTLFTQRSFRREHDSPPQRGYARCAHAIRGKKSARWSLSASGAAGASRHSGPKWQRQEHDPATHSRNSETHLRRDFLQTI